MGNGCSLRLLLVPLDVVVPIGRLPYVVGDADAVALADDRCCCFASTAADILGFRRCCCYSTSAAFGVLTTCGGLELR